MATRLRCIPVAMMIWESVACVYMGAYLLIVFYIDIACTRTSIKTGYLSWWDSSISQINFVPTYLFIYPIAM